MNKQIARVNWSRGRYSDVVRSTIVDPSPLKQGQKVRVIWGKGKREYAATITCYPLIEEIELPVDEPQPRQTKAKRKLVSTFSHFILSVLSSTSEYRYHFNSMVSPNNKFMIFVFRYQKPRLPLNAARKRKQTSPSQRKNQKERYVKENCLMLHQTINRNYLVVKYKRLAG